MENIKLIDDTIYLVPQHAKFEMQKLCLIQKAKGIRLLTLEEYILSFSTRKTLDWTQKYEIYHRLKKSKDQCLLLQKTCTAPEFIEECIHFLNLIHGFNIPIDELPETEDIHKDLKLIISSIYDCETENLQIKIALENITEANVIIYYETPTLIESKWMNELEKKGATIHINTNSSPDYEYYSFNNPRQEIEGCAQLIVERGLKPENTLIYTCDNSYKALAKQVFSRYQIPLNQPNCISQGITFQAAALLEFAIEASTDNFNNCIDQHCFGYPMQLKRAQNLYPYNWDESYPSFTAEEVTTEILSKIEANKIINIISKANEIKNEIYPLCEKLVHSDIKEILLVVDEILRKFNQSENDHRMIKNIQNYFKKAIQYIETKDDLKILIHEFHTLQIHDDEKYINAFSIKNISQANLSYDNVFILGANQKNFPNFISLNGIFNEDYVKQIRSFPSLQLRYDYHFALMKKSSQLGNHIIISYPLNDYKGKTFESSLEIESIVKIPSSTFTLATLEVIKHKINNISKNTAMQLYSKWSETNNFKYIKGSISSLETFVKCPYSYFLHYGCRITEPFLFEIDAAKTGTLFHFILQTLCQKYGKEYADNTYLEAIKIMNQTIDKYQVIFPHIPFEVFKKNFALSLKHTLNHLSEMEANSEMKPYQYEYSFDEEDMINLTITDDLRLCLVGKIDRIDINEEHNVFNIIDYKSSKKILDSKKVFSGQQLQLCTYLLVVMAVLQLKPAGAFYYSFKDENLNLAFQKNTKNGLEKINNELIKKEYLKKYRLNGWAFDSLIYDLINKDYIYLPNSKFIDFCDIETSIENILQIIALQIINGNISCSPNKDACTYCKYHPICKFNGHYTEKEPLVDLPSIFMKKKEIND